MVFRTFARAMALCLTVGAPVAGLRGQGSPTRPDSTASTSVDSLAARLERAEAALALLRQQLAVEATSTVRTRSRLQADLTARLLMNGFRSTGTLNSIDVPTYVERTTRPRRERAVGMTVRQTRVGLSLSVDSVIGAALTADAELDFFAGGSAAAAEGYQFPEPRLRTATIALRWSRTEIMAGSETPLISDLTPITLASVGEPGFAGAGNLWNWMPQVRVSQEVGGLDVGNARLSMALQGALLDPQTSFGADSSRSYVNAGARSGRPYVQGRARFRWMDATHDANAGDEPRAELGIGVHRGWWRTGYSTTTSHATAADLRVSLPRGLELRGEAFHGRALAGLGGAAVEQTLGQPTAASPTGVVLGDRGGWVQVNWKATPTTMAGVGCGTDRVTLADRPARERNDVCAVHGLWRPIQPLVFGLEYRTLRTWYAGRPVSGRHVNFSIGVEL